MVMMIIMMILHDGGSSKLIAFHVTCNRRCQVVRSIALPPRRFIKGGRTGSVQNPLGDDKAWGQAVE